MLIKTVQDYYAIDINMHHIVYYGSV